MLSKEPCKLQWNPSFAHKLSNTIAGIIEAINISKGLHSNPIAQSISYEIFICSWVKGQFGVNAYWFFATSPWNEIEIICNDSSLGDVSELHETTCESKINIYLARIIPAVARRSWTNLSHCPRPLRSCHLIKSHKIEKVPDQVECYTFSRGWTASWSRLSNHFVIRI